MRVSNGPRVLSNEAKMALNGPWRGSNGPRRVLNGPHDGVMMVA
jgi:hypothetical protein